MLRASVCVFWLAVGLSSCPRRPMWSVQNHFYDSYYYGGPNRLLWCIVIMFLFFPALGLFCNLRGNQPAHGKCSWGPLAERPDWQRSASMGRDLEKHHETQCGCEKTVVLFYHITLFISWIFQDVNVENQKCIIYSVYNVRICFVFLRNCFPHLWPSTASAGHPHPAQYHSDSRQSSNLRVGRGGLLSKKPWQTASTVILLKFWILHTIHLKKRVFGFECNWTAWTQCTTLKTLIQIWTSRSERTKIHQRLTWNQHAQPLIVFCSEHSLRDLIFVRSDRDVQIWISDLRTPHLWTHTFEHQLVAPGSALFGW